MISKFSCFNETNIILTRKTAYLALVLIALNVFIGCFLILWLTHVKKVDPELWTEKYPSLIPIATGSFVFGSILYA